MSSGRTPPAVACISLEPWDGVWRRNQHLASRLVAHGHASRLLFVEPPVLGQPAHRGQPLPGVRTLRPGLRVPKRAGGLRIAGALLRRGPLRDVDVVWVNDPQLGVHCVGRQRAVYDVTDDWRTFPQPPHIARRIVAAEDRLARSASTVVCSDVLAERWQQRYGVRPAVVPNGVDLDAVRSAPPVVLPGDGPHLGYVGTLHAARLDVPLVVELARSAATVHLVGPDALEPPDRATLRDAGVVVHGAVPAADVPGWMRAMDVLLCPHVVDPFTLSLDAIKSHEYLASSRPVVATPTSGFQSLTAPGLHVVGREAFVATALGAVGEPVAARDVVGWDERTRAFAEALVAA